MTQHRDLDVSSLRAAAQQRQYQEALDGCLMALSEQLPDLQEATAPLTVELPLDPIGLHLLTLPAQAQSRLCHDLAKALRLIHTHVITLEAGCLLIKPMRPTQRCPAALHESARAEFNQLIKRTAVLAQNTASNGGGRFSAQISQNLHTHLAWKFLWFRHELYRKLEQHTAAMGAQIVSIAKVESKPGTIHAIHPYHITFEVKKKRG